MRVLRIVADSARAQGDYTVGEVATAFLILVGIFALVVAMLARAPDPDDDDVET